ncbi:autotransporter outer membrane beta-barrel domain-containing protein [Starkeya koreensis]|uniref:Autotransporter outer membrane beta-barrel domain-containing protein n=1 Tax=Ancylobacter koreensis TaxID=266121 RepID=A0ABT0DHJ2_9HYPH|nr:autotransporter outer membrane beta-barrel domain-containing protein [Ancylobacter koreensis]MCK0206659.1 autotransporter outer membrane beta-barrel domain-containing protein [Ancylobacter koreensis]
MRSRPPTSDLEIDVSDIIYGYESEPTAFGVVVANSGVWDFSGQDDYLTPGFANGATVTPGTEAVTTGGVFAPVGSAVDIKYKGESSVAVLNFGTLIGEGGKDTSVVKVDADKTASGVLVYNGDTGVIGSINTPYGWNSSAIDVLSFGFGANWLAVDNVLASGWLADFADAADDAELKIKGGSSLVVNDGLLIGAVDVDSKDSGTAAFLNTGTWFTSGESKIKGTDAYLENTGLIQSAFLADTAEQTKFHDFTLINNGVLSMMDGGVGDRFLLEASYTGYGNLAVDIDYTDNTADVLVITDHGKDKDFVAASVSGSTGIILNTVKGAPGMSSNGLVVVDYSGATGGVGADFAPFSALPPDNSCGSTLCKYGETFYISPLSQGYVNIGGYGAVQSGFYATFLRQDEVSSEFELVTDWGTAAHALPSLITAAQNIWYQSNGVVQDHIYDAYFRGAMPGAVESEGNRRILIWARAGGSWATRDNYETSYILGTPVAYDTGYDQNTYSFFGGADYLATDTWRFGVFGGYITSDVNFNSYGMSAEYSGGSVGGYLSYKAGPFYADAEVKADFLDLDYNSPSMTGLNSDVTNVGVRANVGYRFTQDVFYLEPVVSFAYVTSSFDDGYYGGASVSYDDNTSVRGGIGARVGANFVTSFGSGEVYVLGKLWNEFEGNNSVVFFDPATFATTSFVDGLDGMFGEVAGSAQFYNVDRSFSFVVSAGAEFNSEASQLTAKIGVEKKF